MIISICIVVMSGCNTENAKRSALVDQSQNLTSPQQSPASQPPPPPTPKIEKDFNSNNAIKSGFVDSDPEYIDLLTDYESQRRISHTNHEENSEFLEKYSPAYLKAKQERTNKINDYITQKTQNMDEGLKQSLIGEIEKQANEKYPQIKLNQFNKEASEVFAKKIDEFKNKHKENFFLIAAYDNYNSITGQCCFNLEKVRPHSSMESVALRSKMPVIRPIKSERELVEMNCLYSGKGPGVVEGTWLISGDSGRFKRDWLSAGNFEYGFVLKIPLETMNQVYNSVSSIHAASISRLIGDELSYGNYFCSPLNRNVTYDHNDVLLKESVVSFVRRNSIMLAAKGDPFEIKIKECHLIVLGCDKSFEKIY